VVQRPGEDPQEEPLGVPESGVSFYRNPLEDLLKSSLNRGKERKSKTEVGTQNRRGEHWFQPFHGRTGSSRRKKLDGELEVKLGVASPSPLDGGKKKKQLKSRKRWSGSSLDTGA